MTPNEHDGKLEPSKQNTKAPADTLLQPENTSDAHNIGQYEHPTKVQGYCEHNVLGGIDCEECA